jgi:hypothetical protein
LNHLKQRRSRLQSHPYLSDLYQSVPFHTERIIESLLESGVTYPLMEQADQCMEAEYQENVILQILADGNPALLDTVTDDALDEIEYLLTTLEEVEEEDTSVQMGWSDFCA